MKIAVAGSRNLFPNEEQMANYLSDADEIVSGGARGVDACAAKYAKKHNIALTEILPNYALYGRAAPVIRNKEIVDYADRIVVFWDGKSKGTFTVIKYAEKTKKECLIILQENT